MIDTPLRDIYEAAYLEATRTMRREDAVHSAWREVEDIVEQRIEATRIVVRAEGAYQESRK